MIIRNEDNIYRRQRRNNEIIIWPGVWAVLAMLFIAMLLANTNIADINQQLGRWRWFSHFTLQSTIGHGGAGWLTGHRFVLVVTGVFTLHSLSLYQGALLAQLIREPRYSCLLNIIAEN